LLEIYGASTVANKEECRCGYRRMVSGQTEYGVQVVIGMSREYAEGLEKVVAGLSLMWVRGEGGSPEKEEEKRCRYLPYLQTLWS
jgi:hypothetical protein